MKKLFLLAWPIALAAVSCSNEEVVSVNNDANEIKFTAVAENGTRAQNLFCNVNKPTNFHVWAAVDDAQYFANASFSDKDGDGKYTIDGDTRYWPDASKTVHFYAVTEETAVKNGSTAAVYNAWTKGFNWKPAGSSEITWTTISDNATAQTDLLYAYAQHKRPSTSGTPVAINFRHALSQIVFKAVNSNTTIQVDIDQVDVVNVKDGGKFTMPTAVTTPNIENHATTGSYPEQTSVGKWSDWTNSEDHGAYTTTNFGLKNVIPNNNVVDLTEEGFSAATGIEGQEGYVPAKHTNINYSLLLVPQTTTAWNRESAKDPDATGQAGSYFMVYCRIRNIASGSEASDSDIYLWGSETESKPVYIPFTANWEPGKKYIYTFKFGGNTTGGYDDKGDPVLFPISFEITVDDFVKVTPDPVVPME